MNEAEVLREFDKLWNRVETIDSQGTRGVGVIASQLSDLIKDVAGLEGRMAQHDTLHAQEARDRTSGRRWMVGTAIAFGVLLVSILALILGQHPA